LRENILTVDFVKGEIMQTIERVEITVSLPKDLLEQATQICKDTKISDVIETALRDYVAKETRQELNRRDIEIINANAEMLNKQALETLE
jgi:metal-responsive CopG/Arc/MetJ family transcriptional regulator